MPPPSLSLIVVPVSCFGLPFVLCAVANVFGYNHHVIRLRYAGSLSARVFSLCRCCCIIHTRARHHKLAIESNYTPWLSVLFYVVGPVLYLILVR